MFVGRKGNGDTPGPASTDYDSPWLTRYVGGLLLAFGAFTIGPSLIGLRTLISVNLLSRSLPWRASGLTVSGHQYCTTDTIDSVMPGIAYARHQLYSGHLANFQSLVGGGSPLASVPDLGLLDPLSLPYFVLPLWMAPAFVMLLQLVAAIGGTFLLLRRLGASRSAGMLAGLIYATSGFMVVWSNWPQTRTAALIPLLLWSIERLVQLRRATASLVVALVVAALIFGGFPQVSGFGLYVAGGYLLIRVWVLNRAGWKDRVWPIMLALIGLTVGFLLTSVQLLPFLSQLQNTDLSYRTSGLSGLPAASLLTTVVPNAYGSCIYANPIHGTNPIEQIAYVGAAAIVLAIAGVASGRVRTGGGTRSVRGYFLGVVVFVVVVGWVSLGLREVVVHLPIFAGSFIGRIRVILGFCLAVLAGLGFDSMMAARRRAGPELPAASTRNWLARAWWAVLVWTGAALAGAVVLQRAHHYATAAGFWPSMKHDLIVPGVLGLAAICCVLLARTKRRPFQIGAILIVPLLVVVQSASFFHTILPGDSPKEFYPVTATHKYLAGALGDDRYAASGTMFPATSLYYGLRTPTGHAFQETAWVQLLQAVDPNVMQSPTNSAFTGQLDEDTIGSSPILDRMGVKYFVLPPGDLAGSAEPVPSGVGSLSISTGNPATCVLPSRPLNGISFRLTQQLVPASANGGVTIGVTVRSGGGTVLTSGRFLGSTVPAGTTLSVALAGGQALPPGGELQVRITVKGQAGTMDVAGSAGSASCAPVDPVADNLKIVYADASGIVYERLTALPRIRWASKSTVIENSAQQVAALAAGVAPNTVVLSKPGAPGSGAPATVHVTDDDGDTISAKVTAQGSGYLVVADAMQQPGWSVSVDGRSAPMVAADHAMVAVDIPAGQHQVRFTYRAPGQLVGAGVSLATIIVMVAIAVVDRRRRRRSLSVTVGDASVAAES